MNSENKVPQKAGFLNTSQGIVMFSATQVRKSDRSGEPIGTLVFVRKIRPGLMTSLSEMSQLGLSSSKLKLTTDNAGVKTLKGSLQGESFAKKRQRVISDINIKPLMLLDIEHHHSETPNLFDNRTLLAVLLLTTIPLAILVFVNIYIVGPVSRGTKYINHMLKTNQLKPLKLRSKVVEIDELIIDFNQLIHTIEEQQTELEKLTLLDALTAIANRRAFETFLSSEWSSMQRTKLPMAVLMCDVDYFKSYNDNVGHQAGDEALKQVAQALDGRISRASDLVARYGGEEFVIVLKATSTEHMKSVIDIVLQTVRELKIPHAHSQVADIVTISVGAAIFENFSVIPTEQGKGDLVKAADQALYRAKKAGRNRGEYVVID